MSQSRKFSLAALLMVSTGIMVSENGLDDVFELLNFAAGESLFITSLGRVSDEFLPLLLEQHPFLRGIPASMFHGKSIEAINIRLDALRKVYGDIFEVFPMHPEDHVSLPPEVDIVMLNPSIKIVTLDELDGDE